MPTHATTQTILKNVIVNEVNQSQKERHFMTRKGKFIETREQNLGCQELRGGGWGAVVQWGQRFSWGR